MTAKEKAKELVARMYSVRTGSVSELAFFFAKQTASIAVDEIEKALTNYDMDINCDYWQEVKQEIEGLESA